MFGFIITSLLLISGNTVAANPNAGCVKCHLMRPKQDSLRLGNHGKVATCPDCHEPQGGAVRGFYSVGANGIRHALVTALGVDPSPVRIHQVGAAVVQQNCIRCHGTEPDPRPPVSAQTPRPKPQPKTAAHADTARRCVECHRQTSHVRQLR